MTSLRDLYHCSVYQDLYIYIYDLCTILLMKFNENQTTINFNQTITHTFGEWWSASYTELFNFVRSSRKNLPTDSFGHYFNRFEEA